MLRRAEVGRLAPGWVLVRWGAREEAWRQEQGQLSEESRHQMGSSPWERPPSALPRGR